MGLKNLFFLNQALLLKRCWEVASKATSSTSFLHDRFLVDGFQLSSYYKKASVWLGIKALWPFLLSNIRWLVGNGNSIRFWKDNWMWEVLVSSCNIDQDYWGFLQDKVSSFIINGAWSLPTSFQRVYPDISQQILATSLPTDDVDD